MKQKKSSSKLKTSSKPSAKLSKITSLLAENKTILLIMPSSSYHQEILKIVKNLSPKSVCYVTLSKTSDALKELFKKNKLNLNNIVFIDTISKTIRSTPSQSNNCYYVSSPGALTELSIVIDKFLRHNFDYLIFDSITNLMIYQSKNTVEQFLQNLINKVKGSNTKAVFYALKIPDQESLIKESSQFVDKAINVGK